MSDDRESGCEAAARIRARGLRHANPYGDALVEAYREHVIRPNASDRRD